MLYNIYFSRLFVFLKLCGYKLEFLICKYTIFNKILINFDFKILYKNMNNNEIILLYYKINKMENI